MLNLININYCDLKFNLQLFSSELFVARGHFATAVLSRGHYVVVKIINVGRNGHTPLQLSDHCDDVIECLFVIIDAIVVAAMPPSTTRWLTSEDSAKVTLEVVQKSRGRI